MKAARVLRFGPANVIEIDDLPQPQPAAGQLLVRVRAEEWAIGMPSSGKARLNSTPCRLSLILSYQESWKRSDQKFPDSSWRTKYTG